ncbi:MAG: mechanosensitive ion channel family protein [Terriglobia bacterium]
MGNRLLNSLTETTQNLGSMVAHFLPHLLAMVIIVVLGGIVAWILKVVVRRILEWVKFNQVCEAAGFSQLLAKTALPSATELLSRLVFWVVWVAFWLAGINALGVAALQQELTRFYFFLPQIFVAVIILIVGMLIANFFGRATLLAAVNSNFSSPRLLSSVVRFLIIILAVTMALERIGLGHGVIIVAFAIAFGAVMLGLALAFGLGGRDAARRLLEHHVLENNKKNDDDEISHL